MAQPYAYFNYPFTVTLQGNQLVFTFSGIPTTPLAIPPVHYINANQLTMEVNRLNNNLVQLGDKKGVITVSWILATIAGSAITNMATFLQALSGLAEQGTSGAPIGPGAAGNYIVGWNGTNYTTLGKAAYDTTAFMLLKKLNAQTFGTGTDTAMHFDQQPSLGTDINYNTTTDLFTVVTTGTYNYNANFGLNTSVTGSGVYYYMRRENPVLSERASFIYNTSYGTFGGQINFTAGDTFTIRVQNASGISIANNATTNITTQFSICRVPTSFATP